MFITMIRQKAARLMRLGAAAAALVIGVPVIAHTQTQTQTPDYSVDDVIRFFEAVKASQARASGVPAAPAAGSPAPVAEPPSTAPGLCLGTAEQCGQAAALGSVPVAGPQPFDGRRRVVRPSRSRTSVAHVAPTTVQELPAFDLLVSFAYNSAELTPDAMARLERFAEAINSPQLAGTSFLIEGHTDAVGSQAFNQTLSQRRAEAVVEFLADRGVAPSRLRAVGRGEAMPRVPDPFDAQNRRVESKLLSG